MYVFAEHAYLLTVIFVHGLMRQYLNVSTRKVVYQEPTHTQAGVYKAGVTLYHRVMCPWCRATLDEKSGTELRREDFFPPKAAGN